MGLLVSLIKTNVMTLNPAKRGNRMTDDNGVEDEVVVNHTLDMEHCSSMSLLMET